VVACLATDLVFDITEYFVLQKKLFEELAMVLRDYIYGFKPRQTHILGVAHRHEAIWVL
jgi:hypothetical protein